MFSKTLVYLKLPNILIMFTKTASYYYFHRKENIVNKCHNFLARNNALIISVILTSMELNSLFFMLWIILSDRLKLCMSYPIKNSHINFKLLLKTYVIQISYKYSLFTTNKNIGFILIDLQVLLGWSKLMSISKNNVNLLKLLQINTTDNQ